MPKNLGLYNNDLSVPRKKDLNALETRIKTNEDDIAMAQSDIEGLSSDVGTLKTDVGQVKTALGSKQDTIVGGASTIVEDNLTADKALVSDASGKVAVSEVTSTELGYLSGMTVNVATAIAAKANKTDLDGVRYQLAAKADQSAVDALRHQVNTKASSLALDNVLVNASIPIFSTTSNYTTNEYVWKNNRLYQANEDIPAGAWDATKWTQIVVVEELDKKYSADNPPPYPVTSVNGMTGAVTIEASGGFKVLAQNATNGVANDTTAKWAELGPGYSFFGQDGQLVDQPQTYGFVLNYVYGSDVFQIWSSQNQGPIYYRNGNAGGWGNSWRKFNQEVLTQSNQPSGQQYGALWFQT